MKMTLLEMVQNILSAVEADDVNSISDTPEGLQVAEIVKEVYFQMQTWATLPELHDAFFTLEGLSDTTKPVYLKIPDDVETIFWFKYDIQDSESDQAEYRTLTYKAPELFFEHCMGRDSTETTVTEITTDGGVPLWVYNDRNPEFYTVLNDKYLVCDAYDSAIENTLQGSKTVAAGKSAPTFTISDSFVPNIDDNLFPFLLAEAKAVAFVNIKQVSNSKHERTAREQKVRHQNERNRLDALNNQNFGPNYGRRKR